jgi:hypothetical protein
MIRGILIAGNDSALVNAIEVETARRADRYALALVPGRMTSPQAEAETRPPLIGAFPARISLEWNPSSAISARTLVIAAENRLERIDEAILVCDPQLPRCAAARLGLADIEALVGDQVKGWFFLVRELAATFKSRGDGMLALVYPESGCKDDANDVLAQAAIAVFRSLTHSLLAAANSEPYLTLGFSGSEAGDEAGFAAFIARQLEDGGRRGSGKLHKYGKTGFFR